MPLDSSNYDITIARPDVFSLEGLIAWLETQDPETDYDFNNCDGACLLDTYLTAMGLPLGHDESNYVRIMDVTRSGLNGPYADVSRETPWTYGAALSRALALQRRESAP